MSPLNSPGSDNLSLRAQATIAALERKLLEKEEELQHLADRKFPLCLPSVRVPFYTLLSCCVAA
jgi:hypothetical protein